jgi:xanthine dehydrogenase accessory factor
MTGSGVDCKVYSKKYPSLLSAFGLLAPGETKCGVPARAQGRACVAFIGAGGKTTTMMRVASECLLAGFKVLITTTTKIFVPESSDFRKVLPLHLEHFSIQDPFFPVPHIEIVKDGEAGDVVRRARDIAGSARFLVLGGGSIEHEGERPKITSLHPDTIDAIWDDSVYDFILVEADGAAGRPLKIHRDWEPVIPSRATHVVYMVGADAVGRPVSDNVIHTPRQASISWGLEEGDYLSPKIIKDIIMVDSGARAKTPQGALFLPVINKVDNDDLRKKAMPLVRELLNSGAPRVVLTSWKTNRRTGAGNNDDDVKTGGSSNDDHIEVFTCDRMIDTPGSGPGPVVGAVVLAAGASRRLGHPKMLLPVGECTLIERTMREVLSSKVNEVVVVTGHAHSAVENVLSQAFGADIASGRLRTVYEPDFMKGQSRSLKAGIEALSTRVQGALLVLGDQPFITSGHLNALIEDYSNPPLLPGRIVVPVSDSEKETGSEQRARPEVSGHRRMRGNPVLIDRYLFPEILKVDGDVGGRHVILNHPDLVRTVASGPEVLWDIDTWGDYQALLLSTSDLRILVRGAGDLATGVAHRLHQAGFKVAMTEVEHPLVIRRTVSFANSVFGGSATVDGVRAVLISSPEGIPQAWAKHDIPVMIDPELQHLEELKPHVLVDGIMAKRNLGTHRGMAPVVIALGPGFEAPVDADAVVETERGHYLGSVIYEGSARPDTGVPGVVAGHSSKRLIRSPADGMFTPEVCIGDAVEEGGVVGKVNGKPVISEIKGVVRGLIHEDVEVKRGMKIGDIDPRGEPAFCFSISDKARSVGGGVLEALMHLLFVRGRIRELGKERENNM